MFESIIGLVGQIINAFPKIKKPAKKRIGREFAKLYISLTEVIENGSAILKLLRNVQEDKKINTSKLMTLLFAQAERISKIRSIVDKSDLETILKIHLPQLEDLKVLLGMKGSRIAVLNKQLKYQKLTGFHQRKLIDVRAYPMRWWSDIKIVPPTEDPLKKSQIDLNELKRLSNLFRQFLVGKFDIDEII
jgi:transcription antitermination factor NusA-like protein